MSVSAVMSLQASTSIGMPAEVKERKMRRFKIESVLQQSIISLEERMKWLLLPNIPFDTRLGVDEDVCDCLSIRMNQTTGGFGLKLACCA